MLVIKLTSLAIDMKQYIIDGKKNLRKNTLHFKMQRKYNISRSYKNNYNHRYGKCCIMFRLS